MLCRKFNTQIQNILTGILLTLSSGSFTTLNAETQTLETPAWKQFQNSEVIYNPEFLLDHGMTDGAVIPGAKGLSMNLGDIGFKKGITFEGAETVHEINLNFPLPSDTKIENANFYLKYRISPLLNEYANIQLSVENFPLKQVLLNAQGIDQALLVEIPKRFLINGNVKLTLRTALPVSDDRCLDTRINASNLHIDADSAFTLHYSGEIGSLRDAWTLMPSKVVVSIPDRELSAEEFNITWELLDILRRQGKEAKIAKFPTQGDIVIAKRAELEQLLREELISLGHEQAQTFNLDSDSQGTNMALVKSPVRSVIAILDPQNTGAFQMITEPWHKLGIEDHYMTYPVEYANNLSGFGSVPKPQNALELKLDKLGADTSTRYVRSNIKWNIELDPFRMPAGTRPNRMFLSVIAPPPPNKPAFEMYVYLNDIMVHATRLDKGQEIQEIPVPLPKQYLEPYNRIQVHIQNIDPQGDCFADLTAYPVQILPESSLIVERDTELPKNFSSLPTYLADDFDVYLPKSYLQTPDLSLSYVSALTSRLPVSFKKRTANFIDSDELISPSKPFIAIGSLHLDNLESPVSFDKGEIQVVDKNLTPLLKVNDLPGITVAQLVTSNQQKGLWLFSDDKAGFPDIRKLFLNHDDVAFADHSGLLFTLNSRQPTLAAPYYPETRDWFALLGQYRFFFLALGLLALTLIIVYLFRRAKQHKDTQDNQ